MYWIASCSFLVIILTPSVCTEASRHHVSERSLLFPQFTVLQFTYGVSAPVILPNRTLQLSWCMQQNYELPFNVSNFAITTYTARRGDIDIDRDTFYEYIVQFLDGFGYEGETCLLRAICEIAETPMYKDEEGYSLFEDVVHYAFTPSLDDGEVDEGIGNKFVAAERFGRANGDCSSQYVSCGLPLVDLFTAKMYNL